MPDYQRIVSYLYEYNHGIKGANVGFAKIEKRGDSLRLYFHAKTKDNALLYKIYFYHFHQGAMEGVLIDNVTSANAILELKQTYPILANPSEMDGFLIYASNDYFFGSQWKDHPIDIRTFTPVKEEVSEKIQKGSPSTEEPIADSAPAESPVETMEAKSKLVEYIEALQLEKEAKEQAVPPSDKSFEWKEYPSLSLPSSYGFDSCIKIQLEDLKKLPDAPPNITTNGFLLLNYGNYGHLILARRTLEPSYYLGVPGVFDNEKAFISKLFGFETFLTVPETSYKTGNYGYFILAL